MSFREKSTWVTFVLLLVGFVVYFFNAYFVLHGVHSADGYTPPSLFFLFIALVVGFVVIEIVMHVLFAWRSPKDAKTPKDEREKLIELKAMRPAFYVLMVGAFLTIGLMHHRTTVYHMGHSILFVIWIAELVRYGMQLVYFRRGA
jgi:archaellum biogenesis protein FlaJ (TadC family)